MLSCPVRKTPILGVSSRPIGREQEKRPMRLADVETYLIRNTERFLTWRKRRKLTRKAKQKRKNQILDWIQALLWAAVVVLLINQYLLQAYDVPSASMEDTILGGDRLFVDKLVYGPELIPGFGKMPGLAPARRGDIVVFVNPDYRAEMGRDVTGFEELFNRLVYMLTLTIVNLDRKPNREIAHHFLVKRLIAQPGERIRLRDGRVEIRQAAENAWTPEEDLKRQYVPLEYTLQKKFYPYDAYPAIRDNIVQQTLLQKGVVVDSLTPGLDAAYVKILIAPRLDPRISIPDLKPEELEFYLAQIVLAEYGKFDPKSKEPWPADRILREYRKLVMARFLGVGDAELAKLADADVALRYEKAILAYNRVPAARIDSMTKAEVEAAYNAAAVRYVYTAQPRTDDYFEEYWSERTALGLSPSDRDARHLYERRALGWYIPADRFFPMGDNRDNSRDARYFGAVSLSKLLGRALFRFWPLNRLGTVH
jgi:signal peptidase I